MLFNQVYEGTNECRYRVVLEEISSLMLIDIDDQKAWPFPMEEEAFHSSDLKLIDDPYPMQNVEDGSKSQILRNVAYSTIEPLLNEYIELFDKRERNKLISVLLEQTDKPRLYVIRQLRRYWQRGMAPNALVPDYRNCGGKGKLRRENENKVGRKRSVTPGSGVVINEEIADIFRTVIEGFFLTNEKLPLAAAKDKAIGLFKASNPKADKSSVPTMAQFRYFYQTHYRAAEVIKKRTPAKIYDKDMRPLVSTSGYMNFGPGDRYEIDATIADIYLVSDHDSEVIIGRPVIYFVKDVFSRMIVGLYVGLENPSWVAAMMALANAFVDKVDFCREYGININTSMWPSVGIPGGVMADRGELLYRQADVLVNRFNIKLSNSRAYRGDDKAICERAFNTIQSKFRPYVGGIVEPINGKKRLGRRYELDAELGMPAFTELIIKLVINHNTRHVVDGYDFAPDMPEELPAVPLDLWSWGIRNRTGKLRPCDPDLVRINLLPYEHGTVSEVGITFRGLMYTCQGALKLGWFDRISQNRPPKVEIAFDPRRTNKVYLRPDNSFETYWVCELLDRSRRYKDMSFAEATRRLSISRNSEAGAKQTESFYQPDMQEDIEQLVAREKAKKVGAPKVSATERLHGIRENRRLEKESERDRNSVKPKLASNPAGKMAEVVELRPVDGQSSVNLDYPSLDDFLEDGDD